MFLPLILSLAFLGSMPLAGPEPVGGEPALEGHDAGTRVFFEKAPGNDPVLALNLPPQGTTLAPLVFGCTVAAAERVDPVLELQISAASGELLFAGQAALDGDAGAPAEVEFHWDCTPLDAGIYTAQFRLHQTFQKRAGTARVGVRIIDGNALHAGLREAADALAGLETHLDKTSGPALQMRAIQRRAAAAGLGLDMAQSAYEAGDWPTAKEYADYVSAVCASGRAQLAFNRPLPVAQPTTGATRFETGLSLASAGSVLPVGAAALREMGISFLSLPLDPAGQAGPAARMASQTGTTLMLRMPPGASKLGAGQEALVEKGLDAPLREAVRWAAVSIEGMQTGGHAELRRGFSAYVQARFADIDAVNKVWRSRLRTFSEVAIPWQEGPGLAPVPGYVKEPPYRYDWHHYWQEVVEQEAGQAIAQLHTLLPRAEIAVIMRSGLFNEGAAGPLLERDSLTALGDQTAVATVASAPKQPLLLNFPEREAHYGLMRSLAPAKPLNDVDCLFRFASSASTDERYSMVQAAVWQAAISGVQAMALRVDDAGVNGAESFGGVFPELLDAAGVAQAQMDRLGAYIEAMHAAPARVFIVWSFSARVLDQDGEYMQSVLSAYAAGSYFGHQPVFVTGRQIAGGALAHASVVMLPDLQAMSDDAFRELQHYVDQGGVLLRSGRPIPYDERGLARREALHRSDNTVLVTGNRSTADWLHALDAAAYKTGHGAALHAVNRHGYPYEGVVSRYFEAEGKRHLYLVNLRKRPVAAYLSEEQGVGLDLISGRPATFPTVLTPLQPLLVQFENRPEAAASSKDIADAGAAPSPVRLEAIP